MTNTQTNNQEGRAYVFSYYKGKIEDVIDELPRAQQLAETAPGLKIDVIAKLDDLADSNDPKLTKVVQDAQHNRMNYALRATLPNAGNRKTAEELNRVLANIHTSPLYGENDLLLGGIAYKHGDEYIFLRR